MADTYTLHKNLEQINLHVPKLHASSHEEGGSDPIDITSIAFLASGMSSDNIYDAVVEAFNNTAPATWGSITGTITDQLDLITYLGTEFLKLDASNGPVTEDLTLSKDLTVDEDIHAGRDIYLKAGQKVYLDGGE